MQIRIRAPHASSFIAINLQVTSRHLHSDHGYPPEHVLHAPAEAPSAAVDQLLFSSISLNSPLLKPAQRRKFAHIPYITSSGDLITFFFKAGSMTRFPNRPANSRGDGNMKLLYIRKKTMHPTKELPQISRSAICSDTSPSNTPNHLSHLTCEEQVLSIFILFTKVTFRITRPLLNILPLVKIAFWNNNHMKILILKGYFCLPDIIKIWAQIIITKSCIHGSYRITSRFIKSPRYKVIICFQKDGTVLSSSSKQAHLPANSEDNHLRLGKAILCWN